MRPPALFTFLRTLSSNEPRLSAKTLAVEQNLPLCCVVTVVHDLTGNEEPHRSLDGFNRHAEPFLRRVVVALGVGNLDLCRGVVKEAVKQILQLRQIHVVALEGAYPSSRFEPLSWSSDRSPLARCRPQI
ncbi:MAG: hypothetical protein JWM16_2840 [Verrucomicrobiales bacterium]|nr:hypothetical protein [Verrucomicrobiales bacterium]